MFSEVSTSFNEEDVSFAFDNKDNVEYVNDDTESKANEKDAQKRFAIKSDVLGSLLVYMILGAFPINLTIEMALKQFSVSLTGTYAVGNSKVTMYQFGVEGKHYFSKDQLRGWYLGAGTGYEFLSLNYTILQEKYELDMNLYYINGKVGYQIFEEDFVVDLFGGYRYSMELGTDYGDIDRLIPHSFLLGMSFGAIY